MKTRNCTCTIIVTALVFLLAVASLGHAAGSCVQTTANYPDDKIRQVIFTCTGDAANGSIPNTAINATNTLFITGHRLYQVDAYPTPGGTAPDAADVFILDAGGMDLLGSVDGGTTAYQGLNLIHATLKRATAPAMYMPRAGVYALYQPYVTGALTLKVANQSTVSANYTIVLSFTK